MITIIKMLAAGLMKHPNIARHALKVKKKVFRPVAELTVDAYPTAEPIALSAVDNVEAVRMKKGKLWAREHFGSCWFHLMGTVPAEAAGAHLVILMKVQGEGLSYDGDETGDLITSILSVPDVLQPPTVGKCVIDLGEGAAAGTAVDKWVDAGYNGINGNFLFKAKFCYATLAVRDEALWDYYYDYMTLALLLATDGRNPRLTPALKEKLLSTLAEANVLYDNHRLEAAHKVLRRYYDLPNTQEGVRYTLVGHAHLDLAWMWPKRESMRKAVRSLTNAVRQAERCPDYVFGVSQAQMLDWVRQSTPTLFEKLRQLVDKGNVELQGGMWVECDCNLPSGESLVRQFVYGDEFFLRYFGRTSSTVWLPDAFGFPYTLPQIIKGVGKAYFATTKINWNRVNKFPYQSFRWIGPDGSAVLAHISPEGTYCNDGTPLAVAKAEARNVQKETGTALLIYGVGDGGGGPGEGHVQLARRSVGLEGMARTRLGSAQSFFEELAEVKGLPDYDGELYLEYHRGTYTSQAANKRCNRIAERELHTLEWLLAQKGLDDHCTHELWKTVLFNQFHDILPGSGIERVHRESVDELQSAIDRMRREIAALLPAKEGVGWLNPSPFGRAEYQTHQGAVYLVRADGYSSATYTPVATDSRVGDDCIENDLVKVVFDKGVIVSYRDKTTGIEHAKGGLNRLRLYYDKDKRYDAWNLGPDYQNHPRAIRYLGAEAYMDGGDAVMALRFGLPHGEVRQQVRLGYGKAVRFDTVVDWYEEHLDLRADFVPTIYAPKATCDIQFGSIERDTTNDTSIARAQIEVCAHKYVSVADERGIFALYNDCKYGHRLKEGVLSLNLLRSPKKPDPQCDMGTHHFSYAMDIPADPMAAVAAAYNFNMPMLKTEGDAAIRPMVSADSSNVVIETIKPRRDGKGFAVRLYERSGVATECKLSFAAPYKSLAVADLLEQNARPAEEVLRFAPHEIKTLLVERE